MSTTATLPALVKTMELTCSADHAFVVYTERIGDWWPTGGYSISGEATADVRIEPRAGGRIFEIDMAGAERIWGTLTVWDPKRRLVHSWHPGVAVEEATEVEVTFTGSDAGCVVRLEHRYWPDTSNGAKRRSGYDAGWDDVLDHFFRLVR